MTKGHASRTRGFTLIEILIAVVVLVMAMTLIVLTFSNISRAWRDGTSAAANLNHADAILDQVVAGLRSAYYKKGGNNNDPSAYGFWLEDDGSDESAKDSISWVKTGSALVDPDSPEGSTLHRVVFTVSDDNDLKQPCAVAKSWRPFGHAEDFDPEDLPFFPLSSSVCGFDCEVSTNVNAFGEIEWETEWEDTNSIPSYLHLSLYLKPSEPDGEPTKVERIVSIPISAMSR